MYMPLSETNEQTEGQLFLAPSHNTKVCAFPKYNKLEYVKRTEAFRRSALSGWGQLHY